MQYVAAILGFFSGAFKAFGRVLDMLRTKRDVNQGRVLEQAEQAKRENELMRKETEVLTENRTKDDVAKKLESGTF
mgnify:CR=1 FL=1